MEKLKLNGSRKKIRFAVIGCGHIGLRHSEMIKRNPEASLVALCDKKNKSELNLQLYQDVPYFSSIDDLLNSGIDIDVVNVCTPNGLHAEHAIKALNKKIHVVCEKPMGLSKAECESVIFKALQVSRQIFCVMQNRYSPPSVWLKEIIEDGKLGDIFMVEVDCFWNRDNRYYNGDTWKGTQQLDGGTLFTQFSHFVDIMYWIFGDIKNIQGRFKDFIHKKSTDFEDSGFITFDFVNGGIGCLNYSTAVWDTNMESSITVIGSKGSIKLGGQYMNKVEYCHIKNYDMPELAPVSPANDYGAYKGSASNHHSVIQNVIDTLNERTTVSTNALEGLKVVEIIERIYTLRDATVKKFEKKAKEEQIIDTV